MVTRDRRLGARWVREVLRRLERAEQAAARDEAESAFDTYLAAYHLLAARWPDWVRTEDDLDDWFEGQSDEPSDELQPISDGLAAVLWLRDQVAAEDDVRRGQLRELALDVRRRLEDEDSLVREALLTLAYLAVLENDPAAGEKADDLAKRYPDDPWIALDLCRAFGRLLPPETRDIDRALHFARRALELGGGEAETYVFEETSRLLEEAGRHEERAEFESEFWTAERLGNALRTDGPDPPESAVASATRLGPEVEDVLLSLLTDEACLASARDSESEPQWWASYHAMRLLAARAAVVPDTSLQPWLEAEVGTIRDILPMVLAHVQGQHVPALRDILADRRSPLRARELAAACLGSIAHHRQDEREAALRVLRRALTDELAPRSVRTEVAYRLALANDTAARPIIEEGLRDGSLNAFLFDEEDVTALYSGVGIDREGELGLAEGPLDFYTRDASEPRDGDRDDERAQLLALAELLETLQEPPSSPGQRGREAAGGVEARLDAARARLLAAAMEEVPFPVWANAMTWFMGELPRAADDCLELHLEWAFGDFVTLDWRDERGDSVASRLLTTPPLMTAEERQAVETLHDSRVAIVEVIEPGDDDEAALCRDVLSGEELRVRFPSGLAAVRWDVMLGRRVRVPGGPAVLLYALRLPQEQRAGTIQRFDHILGRLTALRSEHLPPAVLERQAGSILLAQLVRGVHESEPPVLRDSEGATLVFCEAVFDVRDHATVAAVLDSFPDIERSPGGAREAQRTYRWVGAREPEVLLPDARRLLGELALSRTRLVLSCHSRERLEEGRRRLEEAAGPALHHRADTFTDPLLTATGRAAMAIVDGSSNPEVPPEARAAVVDLLKRHYARWVDAPLPALGGRTPREAVGQAELRPAVEELLRVIENVEARRHQEQGVSFDTAGLRSTLGLEPRHRPAP